MVGYSVRVLGEKLLCKMNDIFGNTMGNVTSSSPGFLLAGRFILRIFHLNLASQEQLETRWSMTGSAGLKGLSHHFEFGCKWYGLIDHN
jgi:hypothetical protein